jgi:hypothetical protein
MGKMKIDVEVSKDKKKGQEPNEEFIKLKQSMENQATPLSEVE